MFCVARNVWAVLHQQTRTPIFGPNVKIHVSYKFAEAYNNR